MSPKMPKEHSDFRRKQILEATWKCFAERGYHETTMRHIARSINVSTGVIYNYFKSKDEILDGLLEYSIEAQSRLFEAVALKNSAGEAMLELFNACFESCPVEELKESNKANIYIWTEAIKKKKIQNMINFQFAQTRDSIALLIRDGILRGEIQPDLNPDAVAGFFMALIVGLQLQSVLIEELNVGSYFNEIKKILFGNMWRELKND
jgi:AcrR family transcriptional regulator